MKKIKSRFTSQDYYSNEAIRILDPMQAALYWTNGVIPLDIFPSRDYKTDKALIVYVFRKSETKEVFDKWCRRELS